MRKRKTSIAVQSPVVVDQHLTVPDVAARLQVARSTVYKFINNEGLPTVTIAGMRRISASDLNNWLNSRKRTNFL